MRATHRQRSRLWRWTGRTLTTPAVAASLLLAPAAPAGASEQFVGTVLLPDGTAAANTTGALVAGFDSVAHYIFGQFTTDNSGAFAVPIPADDRLVSLARANGDRLVYAVALGKTVDEVTYRAVGYAEAVLTDGGVAAGVLPQPTFAVPGDPVTYVLDRVPTQDLIDTVPPSSTEAEEPPVTATVDPDGATVYQTVVGSMDVIVTRGVGSVTATPDEADVRIGFNQDHYVMASRVPLRDADETELTSPAGRASNYDCVADGPQIDRHDNGWHAYPPKVNPPMSDAGINYRYMHHMYQSDQARVREDGATWQVEHCISGGAKTANGWRLRLTGAGVWERTARRDTLIGHDWTQGSSARSLSSDLQINVVPEVVTITGDILNESEGGDNKGSAGAPGPVSSSASRVYAETSVHGFWREVYAWYHNELVRGSRDWQGSVTQALYEYVITPEGDTRYYNTQFYWKRRCTAANAHNCRT